MAPHSSTLVWRIPWIEESGVQGVAKSQTLPSDFTFTLYLLWRSVCLDLLPFFFISLLVFLILTCMSCLYTLEINLSSDSSFAIIFSHSEDCVFILFIVFFAVQKLLSLIRSLFVCLFSLAIFISKVSRITVFSTYNLYFLDSCLLPNPTKYGSCQGH